MISDLLAKLPRSQREAVESAGYRVSRWIAARTVLQTRITKGRIPGTLGEFLTHWLSLAPSHERNDDTWLSFNHTVDQTNLMLSGGNTPLATSPLEQALLHLPALRSFWSQELRQQHFMALLILVPQAWLLDAAPVPPGAVIQGLDLVSWEQPLARPGLRGQIQDRNGLVLQEGWHRVLAARDSVWVVRKPVGEKLNVWYGPNDKGQVVLRSIKASP